MLYVIDDKYYVNISPSIYSEVIVDEKGIVKPIGKKIEINNRTRIETIKIADVLKRNVTIETPQVSERGINQKHNRRRK